MPGELWTQVEALFIEASELASSERESFVLERCGSDARIRNEVLALLAYCDEEPPELLAALGADAASLVDDGPAIGQELGPYRIERELGRGGMAIVYLAARADGEFQKRVAIKLIKRGMDTSAVVERLRRERRILAALEHSSIARLLDGGTTADGRPWIAMEYVEGLPIDRFCAERNLTVEERCRLIDKVCDAVSYAHQNLVVHRDLKPTNILVGPDGNPKLLDFGIAKVLGASENDWDASLTRDQRPLTPGYSSPEQMRGGVIATTTDVYSLGVVLYELLAGQRPSSGSAKAGPVIKASAMAQRTGKEPKWAKRLEDDLDNILQMAMRPEPERRYPTVERMQADLRRHLAGLPVSARKETLLYRWGKFLHRHPVGTPAVVTIVLAAVAGMVFITRAEREAQLERHKAEQRLGQLVELANHTLFDVHDSIEKLPGAMPARIQIVHTTVDYLDKLNAESGNDTHVLSVLASAYVRVARVQGSPSNPNLGDARGAEQSYGKARKILDALIKAGPIDTGLRIRDAELRLDYGLLLDDTGRRDEGVAQCRRGVEQVRTILAKDPHNLAAGKLSIELHEEIGRVGHYADPSGTRRDDLEQLPLAEALVREHPRDTDCLLDLASLWSQIGATFEMERQLSDAADAFRKSTNLREQLYLQSPQDVSVQHDLLIAYGHLGDITGSPLFQTLGDYRGGIMWYEKALSIARAMAAADSSNALARSDTATALTRIGTAQVATGEFLAGLETLKAAETLLDALRAASPASVSLTRTLAILYEYQATAQNGLGKHATAIELMRRTLATCEAGLKLSSDLTLRHTTWTVHGLMAVTLAETGNRAAALTEARTSLDLVQHPGNAHDSSLRVYLARALSANGEVYMILAKNAADWKLAVDYYTRAHNEFSAYRPMVEPYRTDMRRADANLAKCERALIH